MKNFIIGVVVGVVLASTGAYAVVAQKAKKAATKENVEKVADSTKGLVSTLTEVFK